MGEGGLRAQQAGRATPTPALYLLALTSLYSPINRLRIGTTVLHADTPLIRSNLR